MKKSLVILFSFLTCFLYSNQKDIRVYDCFPFRDEFDVLEVRLNELNDVVDYFVLVENPLSQSGIEKPLFFEENKQRFAKFSHKIIHIIGPKRDKIDSWGRENEQRNDILLGLKDVKDEDIVIVSDVDEIVNKNKIKEMKELISKGKDPLQLPLKMYRYFINRRDMEIGMWSLAYAASYKIVKQYSPQTLRKEYIHTYKLDDAGWHFADLGWTKGNAYKLECSAHLERNKEKNKKASFLLKKARHGKLVKIDNSYPKYIVDNIEYFKKINFIDDNLPSFWNISIFNKRQKALEN